MCFAPLRRGSAAGATSDGIMFYEEYASHLQLLLLAQAKYAEAAPLNERSQAIREKMLDPDHPELAEALHNRAAVFHAQVRKCEMYQRWKT